MMNKVEFFKKLVGIAAYYANMMQCVAFEPNYYGYGEGSENMYDDDYYKSLDNVVSEIRKDPSLVGFVSYDHNSYEYIIIENALKEVSK